MTTVNHPTMQSPAGFARNADPVTSHQAAHDIDLRVLWNNERLRLLTAFVSEEAEFNEGLIDQRAAELANESGRFIDPTVEATRRCSELRDAGLLVATKATRPKYSGRKSQVSKITSAGRAALRAVAK